MNKVRVGFLTRTLLQNHYRRYYRYEQTFLQGASVHQQGKILALLDGDISGAGRQDEAPFHESPREWRRI